MGAIHELLAALNEAENADKAIMQETMQVNGRKEVWEGYDKILVMHDDARKIEEDGAAESQKMTTTVVDRLLYQKAFQVRNIDCWAQREKANTKAVATVKLPDGTELKDVSVTLLMFLEKYLQQYRALLSAIPTHDTKVDWQKDSNSDLKGAWKTDAPIKSNRTERVKKALLLSEATKEHKAQVQMIEEESIVGHYEKTLRSGRWSPAQKHMVIERVDNLIAEVKKAKARANQTVVEDYRIGEVLFKSILDGLDK